MRAGSPVAIVELSVLSGLIGALAELLAAGLDDNFAIPLAVGAVVTLAAPVLG